MRLFLAVDLDDATRRAAASAVGVLEAALTKSGSGRDVKWVATDNLHLTLHFLGEVQEADVVGLRDTLRLPLETQAFDLRFGAVGTFPPSGSPRVIWIDVVDGGDAMGRVYDELGVRLRTLRFETETRPYRPHLTVGRLRVPGRAMVRLVLSESSAPDVGGCRVDHVTLYQSRLSPRGSTYVALEHTPLGGAS